MVLMGHHLIGIATLFRQYVKNKIEIINATTDNFDSHFNRINRARTDLSQLNRMYCKLKYYTRYWAHYRKNLLVFQVLFDIVKLIFCIICVYVFNIIMV